MDDTCCNEDFQRKNCKENMLKLWELKRTQKLCDVIIVGGSSVIHAHSCILAVNSPILLDKLLTASSGDWSVRKPLRVTSSFILGSKEDSEGNCMDCLSKVIDFMYSGQMSNDSYHSEHLIILSHCLQLTNLMTMDIYNNDVEDVLSSREESIHQTNLAGRKSDSDINPTLNPQSATLLSNSATSTSFNCISNNSINPDKSSVIKKVDFREKSESMATVKACSTVKHRVTESNAQDSCNHGNKMGEFNCLKCKLMFNCFKLYNYHKRVFHKKHFVCLSCNFTSLKLSYILFHLINMDHEENYCSICLYEAPDVKSLKVHLQEHKNDFPYRCYICGNVFRARTEWLRHSAVHNGGRESVKCKKCGESFSSKLAMNDHLLSHKENGFCLCEVCGFTTAYKSILDRHAEKHKSKRNSKKFMCPVTPCSFSTLYKYNLKDHLKSHEVSKSFVCDICSLKFTLEKNLIRHTKTLHNDENEFYKCRRCNYKNARVDKAKIHCEMFHANDPDALIHIMKQHQHKKENVPARIKKYDEKPSNKKTDSFFTNVKGKHEDIDPNLDTSNNSSETSATVGKNTFILSETTGEFHIISENRGESISVASVTSTNVLTIGNFREGTGSVTLNETTGILTLNNINSASTGAVFLNESTGEMSYINLEKTSVEMDVDNVACKGISKVQTQLNECTGEMFTVTNDSEITDFNDDDGLFDSFDMDIGNEDSCDGFDDLDNLLFDTLDFENSDIFLSKNHDNKLIEIPHLNEATGELSFDHVETHSDSQELWSSERSLTLQTSNEDSKDSYTLLLNEVTGELVTEDVISSN